MGYKRGIYSKATAAQQYDNKQLKKASQKMESITLKELGKYSAFKEFFENIPLEQQELSYTNPKIDIINNPNFIEGRNFGFILIKKGFNSQNYSDYIESTETKKHR